MIHAKLHQLIDSTEALKSLSEKSFSALVSFRLSKVIKVVDVETKEFHDARIKLAKEMGSLSEDGAQFVIPPEKQPAFSTQLTDLLMEEVAIPGDQIKIADIEKTELEPKLLATLEWLICE